MAFAFSPWQTIAGVLADPQPPEQQQGRRDSLAVWVGVIVTAIPVWLLWPTGSHGLSGVVYGLLGYLLLIGWLDKRPRSLLLSVMCLIAYGGVLPSLLTFFVPAGVSWLGHVSGFAGGLLAACGGCRDRLSRGSRFPAVLL